MKRVLKYGLGGIALILIIVGVHFFVIKKLDEKLIESDDFFPTTHKTNRAFLVPSKFIDGEQFYVKLPLNNKDTILGFCDTGGGISILSPYKRKDPNIEPFVRKGIAKGIMPMNYILFKDMVKMDCYPLPYPAPNMILRKPFTVVKEPYLMIPRLTEDLREKLEKVPNMEAFLGQGFFIGKSWTLDYPNEEIWLNTPLHQPDGVDPNIQPIGFKKNSLGVTTHGHPRMQIEIDGQQLDVLFDTGASFVLSDNGKKYFNTSKNTIAGSFISSTLFDEWRQKHPDWKYYPASDGEQGIIEVPEVKIGTHIVGPVLFSRRPDYIWSEIMIHSMDKIVQGAIGGSILKHFKITIDYNSELIMFEK
ncbi:hypothetical protein [Flagellimonas baculiformis]|uniref:hypothetical protein n=1 Tax=Flagellimonas baculiformis TaxID=3067310 RepID=UPI00296EEE59|nr:hypothetical protein [Muricauda sp. D6]